MRRFYDLLDTMRGMTAAALCVVMLAAGAFVVPSCGASSQEKALVGTMATLNAAEVTFVQWDGKHQLDIVAACDPGPVMKIQCEDKLKAYRAERDKVLTVIKNGYLAVDAAWLAVNDKTVATAIAAGVAVAQALQALGVGK